MPDVNDAGRTAGRTVKAKGAKGTSAAPTAEAAAEAAGVAARLAGTVDANGEMFIAALQSLNTPGFGSTAVKELAKSVVGATANGLLTVMAVSDHGHLAYIKTKERRKVVRAIVVPANFGADYRHDSVDAMSSVVGVLSQARDDVANQRSGVTERAEAYISEFVAECQHILLGWLPNGRLTVIRLRYPDGVKSLPPELAYWTKTP